MVERVDVSGGNSNDHAGHQAGHETQDQSQRFDLAQKLIEQTPNPARTVGAFTISKIAEIDASKVVSTVNASKDLKVGIADDRSVSAILVSGKDLVIQQDDGSLIVVKNGISQLPSIVIGNLEIPAASLGASLQANGVTLPAADGDTAAGSAPGINSDETAAGEVAAPLALGSSGNNFNVNEGSVGSAFAIRDLLGYGDVAQAGLWLELRDTINMPSGGPIVFAFGQITKSWTVNYSFGAMTLSGDVATDAVSTTVTDEMPTLTMKAATDEVASVLTTSGVPDDGSDIINPSVENAPDEVLFDATALGDTDVISSFLVGTSSSSDVIDLSELFTTDASVDTALEMFNGFADGANTISILYDNGNDDKSGTIV